MGLIVKTRIDPRTLVSQVRSAVAAIDPEQPMADVRTMDEWMARSLEGRRAPMLLLALFGAVALTLVGDRHLRRARVRRGAARARVRHPPGARRRAAHDSRAGARTGHADDRHRVVLGLAGAVALTRYLQSLLFGVGAYDLSVYAGVTVLLLGVALAACYVPARRATRVAPTVALRES